MVAVNVFGGAGEDEGRGSWCTPKWLADLLGEFDLDPCSNSRSHVWATTRAILEDGDDGLSLCTCIEEEVFINPPYARGQVIRWVKHWRHTRFTFLLRWDPSTDWFAELLPHCTHVWFPEQRINFEPPPGVKSSSNPFPHALYMRDPPADRLARLAPRGYLLAVDMGTPATQDGGHVKHGTGDAVGAPDRGVEEGAGAAGWWGPQRSGPFCGGCGAYLFVKPHLANCPTYGERY